MKTFETEKHNIPKGATHYWNESCGSFFAWWNDNTKEMLCPDGLGSWCRVSDLSDDIMHEIPKPRTKTEFVKVEFDCASDAIKFQEGTVNFLAIKSNVIEVYEASGLHDVLKWYERGHTLYRKVEIEIDDQQEFVDRMLEILDFNEAYDGNKIVSDMYDNFGFRFKLVE